MIFETRVRKTSEDLRRAKKALEQAERWDRKKILFERVNQLKKKLRENKRDAQAAQRELARLSRLEAAKRFRAAMAR